MYEEEEDGDEWCSEVRTKTQKMMRETKKRKWEGMWKKMKRKEGRLQHEPRVPRVTPNRRPRADTESACWPNMQRLWDDWTEVEPAE